MRVISDHLLRTVAAPLFLGFACTSAFAGEVSGDPLASADNSSDRYIVAAVYNCCDGSNHKYNIVNYSASEPVTLQEYCPSGSNSPPYPCGGDWTLSPRETYHGYWLSYQHTLKMTGTPPASGSIYRVD